MTIQEELDDYILTCIEDPFKENFFNKFYDDIYDLVGINPRRLMRSNISFFVNDFMLNIIQPTREYFLYKFKYPN